MGTTRQACLAGSRLLGLSQPDSCPGSAVTNVPHSRRLNLLDAANFLLF
jgi:hypothetical protein